jgi:hypothetical protein
MKGTCAIWPEVCAMCLAAMRTLACLLDGHVGEIPHTDVPKPHLRAGARFVHGAAHSGYRACCPDHTVAGWASRNFR